MNETILNAQSEFNRRYGVKFDIEEFDGSVSSLDDYAGGKSGVDDMYRVTFSLLYKKAFANFIDHRMEGEMDFGRMISEFDATIMEPYRQFCREQGRTPPTVYGGWTVNTYLKSVENHMKDLPEDKLAYAATRYSKGQLPMRDMRVYVEQLKNTPDPSSQQLATLLCYTQALKTANEQRTTGEAWRHPFRHWAEKRHVKAFETLLREKLGDPLSESNPQFKVVQDLAKDQTDIQSAKYAVVRAATQAGIRADETRSANRYTINVESANQLDLSPKSERVHTSADKTLTHEKK